MRAGKRWPARLWVSGLLALALGLPHLACLRLPEIHYLKAPMAGGAQASTAGPRQRADLEQALIPGNKVSLLFDGPQTMDAMMASMASARTSINLETYIFDQDELGLKFADLLIAKQREGVRVNVIYDCAGTAGTPEAFFTRMRQAGIQLCPFHPLNPLKRVGRWKINHRDHRKILVVDGLVAFTGGANISGTYLFGSLFRRKAKADPRLGWRDTHLKIEGPSVAALQRLFLATWSSQAKRDLDPGGYFPQLAQAGTTSVRVVASQPGGDFEIYRAYVLAMEAAVHSIHLTAAYFVPDAQILETLEKAAHRGVDVEIILPSMTDSSLVQDASQSFYQGLLTAGVRLYQLKSSILHAKTAVIDGAWSTVGSTNLDMRSFLFNQEVNVIVLGAPFGAEMENAFQEDRKNSTEVTQERWAQRPRLDRIKEGAARILEYWL